jgi:hypothetical protein
MMLSTTPSPKDRRGLLMMAARAVDAKKMSEMKASMVRAVRKVGNYDGSKVR